MVRVAILLIRVLLYLPICCSKQYMPYVYPTKEDVSEVLFLTQNITDVTTKDVMMSQLLYCPHQPECNRFGRIIEYTNDTGLQPCCESCVCGLFPPDTNTCPTPDGLISSEALNETCIRPQYQMFGKTKYNVIPSFSMISKCLPNYTDSHVRSKCEFRQTHVDTTDISLLRPYNVLNESTIYRNIYCALCNDKDENMLIPWTTQLNCMSGTPFSAIPGTQKDLLLTLQKDDKCNIVFSDGKIHDKCYWGFYTTCNQTGLWKTYDKTIDDACNSYVSIYMAKYKNVFCYLCNKNTPPKIGCTDTDLQGIDQPYGVGTFTALIRFDSSNDAPSLEERCPENNVYDELQGVCREVFCPPYFTFDKTNNTCELLFERVSNQMYFVNYITDDVDDIFTCDPKDVLCSHVFVSTLENSLVSNINLDIDVKICHMLFMTKGFLIDGFNKTKLGLQIAFIRSGSHDPRKYIDALQLPRTITIGSYSVTFEFMSPAEFDVLNSTNFIGTSIPQPPLMACLFDYNPIYIIGDYYCPRLRFQRDDITLSGNTMYLRRKKHIFYDLRTVMQQADSFLVCNDAYFNIPYNKLDDDHTTSKSHVEDLIEIYLSIGCSGLSIISLILILFVYLITREVRTVPGLNTMALSAHLLIANALYLFGMRSTENNYICVSIGLLIHYFWLSSILWMNVCSIHMFRVFFVNKTTVVYSKKVLIAYFLYVYLFSAIFVTVNIVEFFVRGSTGSGYLGYGGAQCYITKPEMVIFSFVLPLGLVLLSNIIMFIVVSITITNKPNIGDRNGQERNMFAIYLKLTCLTGVTWVFGIVYQWFPIPAISYLFIILNASQGIFIFIGFGCNIRTRKSFITALHTRLGSKSSATSNSRTFTDLNS